MIVCLFEC
jgi:hypothetical protein